MRIVKSRLVLLIVVLLLFLVPTFVSIVVLRANKDLRTQIEIKDNNFINLQKKCDKYALNDSIQVARITALQMDRSELEEMYRKAGKEIRLLKDAKKQKVEYYIETTKTDTFKVMQFDTIKVNNDTCIVHHDKYIDVVSCPDSMVFEVRDTIKQVISKHYKHRFLCFKWRCDGFIQDIWSTNPHTNIEADKFIKLE